MSTQLLKTVLCLALPGGLLAQQGDTGHARAPSYRLDTIPLPEGEHSVDAVAFLPDGRLACCLSFERIYTYSPQTGEWRLFAEGLHQPIGLWPLSDGKLLVAQRPELTAVSDTDGDGRADHYEVVSDDFGLSGNYAEWTFGPVRDAAGNLFFSLGTGSASGRPQTNEVRGTFSRAGADGRMNSCVPYRGWVMKVTPKGDTVPFANGFREANGLGFDLAGRLFTIDNQGDFVGTSALFHLEEGRFYGHPHSLVWRGGFDRHPFDVPVAELDRMRTRPAVVFPHGDMANSPTQPLCDATGGRFGPFAGQMFLGEMNSPRILRAVLEEVDGQLQGASVIFCDAEGLHLGNNRLAFDPDGTSLWIGQTKYETWVGQSGLQRLTYTGVVPFEVAAMSLTEMGFDLSFTSPVDPSTAGRADAYRLRSYVYNYHEAYGSKKYDVTDEPITAVRVHEGGRRVSLTLRGLRAWRVYDLQLPGVRATDGAAVGHPWVVYNLNRLRHDTPPAPAPRPGPAVRRQAPRLPQGGIRSVGGPQVPDALDNAERRAATADGVRVRRTPGGYTFTEGGETVLVYNRDPIGRPGGDHTRGHYIHPMFGLDGETMTEDMPKDHLHHRGVFWAWTQLWIGAQRIGHPWEQKGLVWDVRDVKTWDEDGAAVLRAHVVWRSPLFVDERRRQRPIVDEVAEIRVHAAKDGARALDFDIALRALVEGVRLGGSTDTKGYGGFSVRIPLPDDLRIEAPGGALEPDPRRPSRPAPWVDFSGTFGGRQGASGLAILTHPDTPGFPQGWTIRRRASCQNPVFPGREPVDLPTRAPLHLRYRVLLHRGGHDAGRMRRAFDDYAAAGQRVQVEERDDRLVVRVGGAVFTEYRFAASQKYPYFFPVNGPLSGRSLTTESSDPYPHHRSLFFACDRVDGGNYWQEGLDRGQIRQERLRIAERDGRRVVFVTDNVWQRPGAPAPFRDRRKVTISAPRRDRRVIDVEIEWTAQRDLRILRTNHALFAARVVPALAVQGGGTLLNAAGARGEAATFGVRSGWMDASGRVVPGEPVEGLAILDHPDNPWSPCPWFTRDYGFLSPTPMQWLPGEALEVGAGRTFRLRYRVVVHAGDAAAAGIGALHADWCEAPR